jgi:hypothetical protein
VLIGALFFDEKFTLWDTCGAILTFTGVILACPLHRGASRAGIGFRLVSIAASSVAIVTEKVLAQQTAIELIIVGGYLIPAGLYLVVRPRNWREQCVLGSIKRRSLIGLYAILYTLMGPVFVVAFAFGNLGETFVISQCRPVLIMVFGAILLHERSHIPRQCVAAIVTLIGLYLLAY